MSFAVRTTKHGYVVIRGKPDKHFLDRHVNVGGYYTPRRTIRRHVNELRDVFNNSDLHIVGKGPSLNSLVLPESGQCICLNDSCFHVKRNRFALQTDIMDLNLDKAGCPILIHVAIPYYEDVYIYDYIDMEFSLIQAVRIGKLLGVKHYILWAFDSIKSGNLGYATNVKSSKPNPNMLHQQRKLESVIGKNYTVV